MTYEETLAWLYHLEVSRGWDLKLESVRDALSRLDSPQQEFPAVHVAGTNGKGSTAAFAHSVLTHSGRRVGLFTSPHLSDFRERIRVGDERVSREAVVDLVDEIRIRLVGSGVELTFFEFTTVMAFLHFARQRVDASVIEVGLGGRLDATNVVVPRVAVVTTIGFDHERYLGSTLAAIAAEKAGIFKPAVPAVVGRVVGEALDVLLGVAAERRSPLRLFGRDFHAEIRAGGFDYRGRRTIRGLRPGLAGRFQVDNAAVALAALEDGGWLDEIPDDVVSSGVGGVVWPGRLEILRERPRVVLDGAHNPAGIAALADELAAIANGRPVHLVFGALADKRWAEMAERLAGVVADVVVVPVRERRSVSPALVAEVFRALVPTRVETSATAAVDAWLDDPTCAADVVVVAGSLFLVGEVRAHLLETNR
jgi:dihydrofolate synthase / folylpolyglutamate synthase